jgi:hypothetical protein
MNLDLMKGNAKTFRMAAERCLEMRQLPDGRIESPLVPAVVNLAFSSELYLKYIIAKEGVPRKGHELDKLFELLDPATQNEIINATSYNKDRFKEQLERHSNAFVDWRYLHDKDVSRNANIEFMKKLTYSVESIANSL